MSGTDQNLVILYGWGPEETGRAASMLHIADTARSMNIRTYVFLFTDGVLLAKKGVSEMLGGMVGQKFQSLLRDELVKFYACEDAARNRGINGGSIQDGISLIGYATFLDMAMEAKTVITI